MGDRVFTSSLNVCRLAASSTSAPPFSHTCIHPSLPRQMLAWLASHYGVLDVPGPVLRLSRPCPPPTPRSGSSRHRWSPLPQDHRSVSMHIDIDTASALWSLPPSPAASTFPCTFMLSLVPPTATLYDPSLCTVAVTAPPAAPLALGVMPSPLKGRGTVRSPKARHAPLVHTDPAARCRPVPA